MQVTEKRKVSIFLKYIITLLLILVSSSSAYFQIHEVVPDPAAATNGDDITIVIHGSFYHTGCDVEEVTSEIEGDTMRVEIIGLDTGGGGQMITPFIVRCHWGELETGQYFVDAKLFQHYEDDTELTHDTLAVVNVVDRRDWYPNLIISEAAIHNEIQYFPVRELTLDFVIANDCQFNAASPSYLNLYYSDDDQFSRNDSYAGAVQIDSIHVDQSIRMDNFNFRVRGRRFPGDQFLILNADGENEVIEANEEDNWTAIPFTVTDTIDHYTTLTGQFDAPGDVTFVHFHEDYLFCLCDDSTGLAVYDANDPEQLQLISFVTFGSRLKRLKIENQIAYVLDITNGVHLIDITELNQPEYLSFIELEDVLGFVVNGSYLYAVGRRLGLQVFNVSSPDEAEFIRCLSPENRFKSPIIIDNLLITWYDQAQYVYRLDQPDNPELISNQEIAYDLRNAVYCEPLIYTSDGVTVRILNAENPLEIIVVGEYENDSIVYSVSPGENFLFLIDWDLKILNTSDLDNIHMVGDYYARGGFSNSAQKNQFVFLSNKENGISVISNDSFEMRVSDAANHNSISELRLLGASPNPFNSTTTIEYSLAIASQVTLRLYNLSGRRIETLVDGRVQAGNHHATLNATNLSSGLYFVRLNSPHLKGGLSGNLVQKIMLVK